MRRLHLLFAEEGLVETAHVMAGMIVQGATERLCQWGYGRAQREDVARAEAILL